MIKKIVCIITLLALSFQATAFAIPENLWTNDGRIDSVFAGVTTEAVKNDALQKMLFELGILDGELGFNPADIAKPSDFLRAVYVINSGSVPSGDENELLLALKDSKLISFDTLPKKVYMDDLLYSAVKLTGYEPLAEYSGGYPAGYIKAAMDKDLLKNCYYHKDPVTNAELAQVLYNIISIPLQSIVSISDTGRVEYGTSNEPSTIMERRFDCVMVEGILNAYGITNIYSSDMLRENEAEINRRKFTTDSDLSEFVGMNVTAFVTENDDETKILTVEEKDSLVTEFESGNVDSVNSGRVNLTIDNKTKKLDIDLSAKIIYNGVYLGTYADEALVEYAKKSANFKAVENNEDDMADVLFIWEYSHLIAKNTVGTGAMLSFKYGMEFNGLSYFDFSEENMIVEVYKNNIPASYADIKAENVVSVAMSANVSGDKYFKINISDKTVTGQLTGTGSDERGTIYNIGNSSYYMTSQFENSCGLIGEKKSTEYITPEIGANYSYSLSFDGKIADVKSMEAILQTAYMLKAYTAEEEEEFSNIKVYDLNGEMKLYRLADYVIYYDADYIGGKRLEDSETVTKINSRPGTDMRTPIKMQMNSAGEVNKIYLPIDRRNNAPGTIDYPLTYDFYGNGKYYGQMTNMKYITPTATPVFQVPSTENADNEKSYAFISIGSRGSQVSYQNLQIYNIDDFLIGEFCVWENDSGSSLTTDSLLGVVENVRQSLNDAGDLGVEITWHRSGTYSQGKGAKTETIFVEDTELVSDTLVYSKENVNVKELKYGDIIQLETYPDGTVKNFRLLFRQSDPGEYRLRYANQDNMHQVQELPSGTYNDYVEVYGEFAGARGDVIKINIGTNEKVVRTYLPMIVLVDKSDKSKTVKTITVDEILPEDKIFARLRFAGAIQVIAIRE